RLLTSLVLASSLILVLPRGWCCIFAALTAKAVPAPLCCCSSDHQADPPLSRPAKRCPCADRDTVLPQHDDAPAPDLPPVAAVPPSPPPLARPAPPGPGPPPPLLLLKCRWLC